VVAVASATTVTHAFMVTPGTVGVGLFMALLIGGGAVWQRRRRQAAGAVGIEGADDGVEFVPSLDATPGELGTVLAGGATYDQVSATVIDLAERGHLHARPLPSTLEGITLSWALELRTGQDDLRGYEDVLLDELGVRAGPQQFPSLTNRSAVRVAALLQAAVVQHGWFTDDPQKARSHAAAWAGTGLLAGLLTTIVLGVFTSWALVGLGVMVGSLLALAVAGREAVRTRQGQELTAHARALRRGLIHRPSQIEPRCFAHAVALGVSTTFATALDARRADTPGWVTADDTSAVTWTSVDDLALTSRYGWAYTGVSPLGGTGG